jgi:hypothetical protein
MKLDPDIIPVGLSRGKHALMICNQAGLDKLPDPMRIEKGEGWHELDDSTSKSFYVWIAATVPNAVALVMGGWFTPDDANKLLEGVPK